MYKFLEIDNLLRLICEEIENLNRLIITKATKSIIKNLPTNERLRPDW